MNSRLLARPWVLLALSIFLGTFLAWSWRHLGLRRAEAREAMARYDRCRACARELRLSRDAGDTVCTAPAQFEYGKVVIAAAAAAGVAPTSVPSPSLGAVVRVGATRYARQAVASKLGVVTMPQCLTFLRQLATGEPPFHIEEIELRQARQPGITPNADLWDPQIKMSYLSVLATDGR